MAKFRGQCLLGELSKNLICSDILRVAEVWQILRKYNVWMVNLCGYRLTFPELQERSLEYCIQGHQGCIHLPVIAL